MADNLDASSKAVPADLQITAVPDTNKDYFNFTVPNLKIDTNYAFQFQYVYADGTLGQWSPGYIVHTNTEFVPAAPSAAVPSTSVGNIPVTLSTFPTNTKRVDIYVIGGIYGTGKVVDSFFAAGTKTISIADAGVYQVSLIAVTPSGINGDPTNTFTITVSSPVTEEVVPNSIVSATATSGVNPLDSSGQLGYINLSITNSTIPSIFGGYIVKIESSTNTWTQTFESKTALTNLYVNSGIMVGSSYTLSVATTNGKIRSDYVAVAGNPISVTDTRTNTSTVSGSLSFSATDSILTVSWTASAEAQVDSYRVQITSNSDTTFSSPLQTIYTKSTNTAFGGLTANTTYRIRVTTRYGGVSGILSTNHTSGTATLDASGAISDGVAPTTNPSITTSNVKSLFGAFAITFPEVANSDAVTYEVFIKPSSSTGIVSSTYKVLEVAGTFAVIKTLADKTTALSYGTDYYIAIRAKDNDGISTGTVTPVGPVQTSQVANADLAADSVYANNIKAGEIDASKMVTDLLFADKTINVGESTSLNRIRLDGVAATVSGTAIKSRIFIGAGNYYDSSTPFFADNTGRFSIADKLKYSSSEGLVINGSGTFTGLLTTGSGLNTVKVGTGVNGSSNGIYIGATGDYIYTDGTLRLGNGGITYSNGVLSVSGNITANSIAANTSLSGLSITGTTGTFGGVTIDSSGITSTSFSVTSTGYLTAQSGTIGGWTINSTQLKSGGTNYIALNPLTPKIDLVNPSEGTITLDPVQGIKDSAGNFTLTPNGTLTLKGSITAGSTITGASFSTTDSSNNYWNSSSFNMGTSSTYINYSGSTITMISGTTTSGSDTNSSPDGNGSSVSAITVNSRIILSSSGLQLRGIPTLGDYTRYNYPYNYYTNTDANSANPNYGMGNAARLRTLIQDPYDHTVYRGFAVYYGQRSSAPSGTTGYTGDLWVSW